MRKQRSGKHGGRVDSDDENLRQDVDMDRVLRADSADAFIRHPDEGGSMTTDDDLAETLAEEFVRTATSGEDQTEQALDQMVPEDIGGPFVETGADEEFADGVDESNPADAEPEAMPRAVGNLAARPREE